MKNYFLILIIFIIKIYYMQSAMAAQTNPINLNGVLPATVNVITSGGNTKTTIDGSTGALSGTFNPAFEMRSNTPQQKHLTLAVTANTSSGYQNAVFNIGNIKYIIMTNAAFPPNVSSLNDIKTGSPNAINNPNAIAYIANDPSNDTGNITITYKSVLKNWDLFLTSSGNAKTTFTISAGTPCNNTFSAVDESGDYKAVVTLSFNED